MSRGRPQEFNNEAALEKAMELFWCQGYEATGLRELLSHMGIARQSMYNTFGDKRALFLKALAHYEKTVARRLLDRLDAPGSPLENIRQVVSAWSCMEAPKSQRGCFLVNTIAEFGSQDPELAEILRQHMDYSVEAFVRAILRAQDIGEVSPDIDSRSMARVLVNTGNGIALLRKIQVKQEILNDILEQTLMMLQ
jgi:TetR/AcrR family transcriptional repressor of nem operon